MRRSVKISLLTAVIALLGFGAYLIWHKTGDKQIVSNKETANQDQFSADDAKVLNQLKSIFLLPEEGTPTMAIITDVEVLKEKNPVFFANAKNGDRLILYPDLAIIYDFQANKIMKIGPVQTEEPAITNSTSSARNRR